MSDYTDVLFNTQTLISFSSVTPNDAGSHQWLMKALKGFGYHCREINHNNVTNFLAVPSDGLNADTILFVGHTDVVPANVSEWKHPPFNAVIDNGVLYGRGAVDMKSSIAAMLAVVAECHQNQKKPNIAFLITSNEEGESDFGIEYVLKHHSDLLKNIKKVLIGEPTSEHHIGDTLKVGRRGSLNLKINISGQAGHVAYPKQCQNPLDVAIDIMYAMNNHTWGHTYPNFDDSKITIVDIDSNSNVFNATPSTCSIKMNWRFNPSLTIETIKHTVQEIIFTNNHKAFEIECAWLNQAKPFFNQSLTFAHQIQQALAEGSCKKALLSTSGGTSDARFFSTDHYELVEFGPRNYSAHKTDEHISINDLQALKNAYMKIALINITSYSTQDLLI